MNSPRSLKLALFALVCAVSAVPAARADLTYNVDVNTTSLIGNPSAPFYVDFQSLFGSGLPQTVTVSNFTLTGGSLVGSGTPFGDVTGSLATSLVLKPSSSSFLNEYYQQFSANVSDIKFTVNLTTNAVVSTPTSFVFAILDHNLENIPTTGVGDSLLFANINGRNSDITAATGLGVLVTATPVPEPSTYGLFAAALAAVGIAVRRRRRV